MAGGLSQPAAVPLRAGRGPSGLASWWALERHARLRAAAQTPAGRAVLVGLFMLAAQVGGVSLPYVLAAAAFALLPAWRTWIALAAAALALARSSDKWLVMLAPLREASGLAPPDARILALLVLAAYMACAWLALVRSRSHPAWLVARRPVLSQFALAALVAALASLPALPAGPRLALWLLLSIACTHLWILAYALQDQRSRTPAALPWQMGLFHPFWRAGLGSLSPTPFGKGAAFLRRHQAQTAEELAVTQLKGLKLLAWALVLTALNRLLHGAAGWLGIASTEASYAAFLAGRPLPVYSNWASQVVSAAGAALSLAILGHKIIAIARLAGFRLPRNTWRPLEARTLADFWNRYYYYFKELLVDFFFLPTFVKVFRRHPRLRVFFATFMAAGVGNAAYHFLRDIHLVAVMGWREAAVGYLPNLFYCAVLALGIGISQARLSAGRRLSGTWTARLWSVLCVWSFVVCLQVFLDESRTFAFGDRVAFFLGLFGV